MLLWIPASLAAESPASVEGFTRPTYLPAAVDVGAFGSLRSAGGAPSVGGAALEGRASWRALLVGTRLELADQASLYTRTGLRGGFGTTVLAAGIGGRWDSATGFTLASWFDVGSSIPFRSLGGKAPSQLTTTLGATYLPRRGEYGSIGVHFQGEWLRAVHGLGFSFVLESLTESGPSAKSDLTASLGLVWGTTFRDGRRPVVE